MQNLELDTFEYEEDTSLGTLQIEQVENGTKIMVEFFPNNQSKESFENAEFSEVYDILELSPLALNMKDLFMLRMQHATNQLDNPMQIAAVKKDIARIKTIIREKETNV